MARLGDVVKIAPSTASLTGEQHWLLNLDMVEQQTGRIIEYHYVDTEELDGSIVQFGADAVLYSKLRPNLNKVVLPEMAGFATSEMLPLVPDTLVLSRSYLAYFLRSEPFVTWAVSKTAGAKMPRLGSKELLGKEIPIPSLAEQSNIAAQFEKVDSLISLRKQQITNLDELVKARFVEMFGDIIHNTKQWPQYRFDTIASSRLGKMLDAKKQTGTSSYPYLANFNVQWFRFDLSKLNSMDFDENDQVEFALQEGDLLVCEGGEIGRCAVWHNEIENCYFQKAIHRVRCNKAIILPEYLAWWFKYNCEYGGFSDIEGAKATIAHLPGAKLKALTVTVPVLSLQHQFAAFVAQTDQQKLTIQHSLAQLELLKKALMQKYFG